MQTLANKHLQHTSHKPHYETINMPVNHAAVLVGAQKSPLEIRQVEYTAPTADEIVIKNEAVAVNPCDAFLQKNEPLWPLDFPVVLGCDIAGTVAEVGSNASSRFKVGDRVLGGAFGGDIDTPNKYGAFQNYTVSHAHLAAHIPDDLSFEAACAIPLALNSVAAAMYIKKYLALPYPSLQPKPTGMTLLLWGGATSLGTQAIQLARASGVDVITTASPKNFDLLRKLGANEVFDYKSPNIVQDLIHAFKGKKLAGALSVGGHTESIQACMDVVAQSEGRKFVAVSTLGMPDKTPEGVKAEFVRCGFLRYDEVEVGNVVYRDYLPDALAKGKFIATPEPLVVGKGLEDVQKAIDERWKMDVSAKKIVVSLK